MSRTRNKLSYVAAGQVILSLVTAWTGLAQDSATSKKAVALYQAGSAAVARNDLPTALTDFEQAVHLNPSSGPFHSALGFVLLKIGKVQESVPELEEALAKNPSDTAAGSNLAEVYKQLGLVDKEVAVLARMESAARTQKRALPGNLYVMYALALAGTHRLPEAITQMRRAIAMTPHNAGLLDDLGSLYASQQDWPDAERSFRAALASNGNLASAHLHLGLALAAQQKPEANDELVTAYRLAPNDAVIDLEYGRSLAAAGDDARAVPLLQKANDAPRHPIEATYQLGLALQRTGRTEEAIPLYQTVLAVEPENADLLTNLGMALCQVRKAEEALPLLQKAVSLAPKNITSLEDLTAAFIQLNQFDQAIAQLKAALQLDPNSPQLHYNLGVAYKLNDDPADAIPEYAQAEKLDPHQSEAPYALGMLYMQAGRYEEAARELKASLAMQPVNGEGWATLGSVYSKLNQLSEAEGALKQAIAQLPQQPDPHLTLAAVLVKENKPDNALAERKTAAGLMRNNMNRQRAEVSSHSGEGSLKSGDLARAHAQFSEALSFDPTYSDAHAGLAKVYDAEGKTAQAAAERSKIQGQTQ